MRLDILENADDSSMDSIFKSKLQDAKYKYLELVYPFNRKIEELPDDRAKIWQTKCAIELYKLNDESSYTQYSENGLQWTKSKAGLSQDLLNELPPAKAGVPIG